MLDRLITITHAVPGSRNQYGEYVEGVSTDYRVWAELMPHELTDEAQQGGVATTARRKWRIRWLPAVRPANTVHLSVTDGQRYDDDGSLIPWQWSVENLIEDVGRAGQYRERWMLIEGFYERGQVE